MQPKTRRVHGAEIKAQVLAECQQPGASVAAVALAHDLNANLVRRWLVGRGLKRTGLVAPRAVRSPSPTSTLPVGERGATPAASLHFLPVELSAPSMAVPTAELAEPTCSDATIDIELHRAGTELRVRWPAAQAESCAAWLREFARLAR